MATIKTGTYRFNDVLTEPSADLEQSLHFSVHTYLPSISTECHFVCSEIGVCKSDVSFGFYVETASLDLSSVGFNFPRYVYTYGNGAWKSNLFGTGIQTITIPTDQEVSAEFLTWFTANTNEVKAGATIKGTWQFNEVITGITSEEYNEVMLTLICGKKIRSVNRMRVGGTPNEPDIQCRYVNADGNVGHFHIYDSRGWLMGKDRLVTFVGEQTVSADFYDWFTSNAVAVNDKIGEVKHQGNTIAAIYPGRSTVIKCAGMNMASDVVVSVADNVGGGDDANIVPLIIGDAGTYDANSPVIVTETFTGGGEPDAVFNFWGYSIPFFKAKKLVAKRGIADLVKNENFADRFQLDLFGEVVPLWQMDNGDEGNKCFIIYYQGLPALVWICGEGSSFSQEDGFEVGGVYLADAWTLLGETGSISISALGIPEKPADGFMPVDVVIPIEDELVIDIGNYINSSTTIDDGKYYRTVRTKGLTPKHLTITPTTARQTFTPDKGWYFSNVTVEPMDLSDLSNQKVPCGIYLDPMPPTDLVFGERLTVSGGQIIVMYTNGETNNVTLINTDVWGWDKVTAPGTYILTVKYAEQGINMQTTYKVNVTEAYLLRGADGVLFFDAETDEALGQEIVLEFGKTYKAKATSDTYKYLVVITDSNGTRPVPQNTTARTPEAWSAEDIGNTLSSVGSTVSTAYGSATEYYFRVSL